MLVLLFVILILVLNDSGFQDSVKSFSFSCTLFFIFTFTAPFFVDCISEQDLDEMNIEIIRNTLYKVIYIDDIMLLTLGLSTSQKFSSVVFQNALKAKWLTEANTVII